MIIASNAAINGRSSTPSQDRHFEMSMHGTAIIDPGAKIHPSCKIGPYCTIGSDVELGEGCELISHVAVEGPTTIGARNRFFPFSSIVLAPPDLSYKGHP